MLLRYIREWAIIVRHREKVIDEIDQVRVVRCIWCGKQKIKFA